MSVHIHKESILTPASPSTESTVGQRDSIENTSLFSLRVMLRVR